MDYLYLPPAILIAVIAWTLISTFLNYKTARTIGFPIVISPVAPLNPFWILTWRASPSVLSLKHLPFGLGTWARCTCMGWSFQDKYALHDELGPIFTIVTPGGNEVSVADSEVVDRIFAKRKEFTKPAAMYERLNIFGPNLNTVEGDDWQRQRRLTAPNFNEKISCIVWKETIRQAQDMAQSWVDQGTQGTLDTVPDTATLALHVLTRVGFGTSYPFHGGVRDLPAGHTMTYRDALSLCLRNITIFAIIPKRVFRASLLPKSLRALGIATEEFQKYMEEMLSYEREMHGYCDSMAGNLMSSLARASDDGTEATGKDKQELLSLTDDEIFGNIFAFNLAGQETTANTVAAALVLLAAHPECQTWLAEEVQCVFADHPDPLRWNYEDAFPKLQRCLAVMYETLRLYGSITFIPKSTGFHTQTLAMKGKEHILPPNTAVTINVQALHTDPITWGPDALEWRPDRWLKRSTTGQEEFTQVQPGNYVPWADGPRVCVGRKFAQVEFVAVMATLFWQYRVQPKLQPGQSASDGRRALMRMIHDSAIFAITLQIQQPRSVGLVWEARA